MNTNFATALDTVNSSTQVIASVLKIAAFVVLLASFLLWLIIRKRDKKMGYRHGMPMNEEAMPSIKKEDLRPIKERLSFQNDNRGDKP